MTAKDVKRDCVATIAEEEIGNDVLNRIGLRDTLKIISAIERAIEIETWDRVKMAHVNHTLPMILTNEAKVGI